MDLEMVAPETLCHETWKVLWISDDFLPNMRVRTKEQVFRLPQDETSTASAAGNK